MYVIKGWRNFKGHEGEPCAQGSLYSADVKVASWSDDSHGGPMRINFVSAANRAEFIAFGRTALVGKLSALDEPYKPETMSEWDIIKGLMYEMTRAEEEEQLHRKVVKSHIAFYLRDEKSPEGKQLMTARQPYTEQNVAALRAEYGAALLEIVNERFNMPYENQAEAELRERNAWLKKQCKTKTLFVIRDEATGENTTLQAKRPYSAMVVAQLRAKYPKNLVEIINERYL